LELEDEGGRHFMIDSYLRELRNIRITLVILTIILALSSGSRSVTVDHNSDQSPFFNYSNMVPLENGHFGVLSGDSQNGGNEMIKVYFYDQEKNEVILKKEVPLIELME
jgi:hypothetical protein